MRTNHTEKTRSGEKHQRPAALHTSVAGWPYAARWSYVCVRVCFCFGWVCVPRPVSCAERARVSWVSRQVANYSIQQHGLEYGYKAVTYDELESILNTFEIWHLMDGSAEKFTGTMKVFFANHELSELEELLSWGSRKPRAIGPPPPRLES